MLQCAHRTDVYVNCVLPPYRYTPKRAKPAWRRMADAAASFSTQVWTISELAGPKMRDTINYVVNTHSTHWQVTYL